MLNKILNKTLNNIIAKKNNDNDLKTSNYLQNFFNNNQKVSFQTNKSNPIINNSYSNKKLLNNSMIQTQKNNNLSS